jgi:hypothetical protein
MGLARWRVKEVFARPSRPTRRPRDSPSAPPERRRGGRGLGYGLLAQLFFESAARARGEDRRWPCSRLSGPVRDRIALLGRTFCRAAASRDRVRRYQGLWPLSGEGRQRPVMTKPGHDGRALRRCARLDDFPPPLAIADHGGETISLPGSARTVAGSALGAWVPGCPLTPPGRFRPSLWPRSAPGAPA